MTNLPNIQDNSQLNVLIPPSQATPTNFQQSQGQVVPVSSVGGKEKETIDFGDTSVEEIGVLPEVPGELKEAGVEQISETVTLPQPVSDLTGMVHAGPTTPISTQQPLTIKVPLTDDQIQKALHQKIYDSILWLAYWCVRQVKIAHARITGRETS